VQKAQIACAGAASFLLSYFLNPLNQLLQESLVGPLSLLIQLEPASLIPAAKIILLSLLITLPAVLVARHPPKQLFFVSGAVIGISISLAGLARYFLSEKDEISRTGWYIIIPVVLLTYFIFGFIGGGLWGTIGKRIFLRSVKD
jgi:hypothetical protein